MCIVSGQRCEPVATCGEADFGDFRKKVLEIVRELVRVFLRNSLVFWNVVGNVVDVFGLQSSAPSATGVCCNESN